MLIAFSMIIYNQDDKSEGSEELIWDMVSTGSTGLTGASCQLSYQKEISGPWYLLLLQSLQVNATLQSGTMYLCSRIGRSTRNALQ